jgi:hypothetical protein
MSAPARPAPGSVAWFDRTVTDAPGIRDFYAAVVGWRTEEFDMGDHADFNMLVPESGAAVAGVCHAVGVNADVPAQWLAYVVVTDLDVSMARCTERGGSVVAGPKGEGNGRYCVIRDPAGAVLALMEVGAD